MTQLARLNPHTSAILDVLNAELKTFDAGAPDLNSTPGIVASGTHGWGWQGKPGESAFKPYRVLYPIIGGTFEGPLGCPSDDASLIYQVTCVGRDRPQCEWIVDNTNDLLVEQPLTVAGRSIMRVWCDMAGGGARRDDTVQPPVFIATPRYRVESTPVSGGS